MNKEPQKDWEKVEPFILEFMVKETYRAGGVSEGAWCVPVEHLRVMVMPFIRDKVYDILSTTRQEAYKEGVKDEAKCMEESGEHHTECRQSTIAQCVEVLEELELTGINIYGTGKANWGLKQEKGYNQALRDVKEKLNQLKARE